MTAVGGCARLGAGGTRRHTRRESGRPQQPRVQVRHLDRPPSLDPADPGHQDRHARPAAGTHRLPRGAVPIILLALPTMAWRFLSTDPSYWGTGYHYGLVLMPILFGAFVDVLRSRPTGMKWILLASVLVTAYFIPQNGFAPAFGSALWHTNPATAATKALFARIPSGNDGRGVQSIGTATHGSRARHAHRPYAAGRFPTPVHRVRDRKRGFSARLGRSGGLAHRCSRARIQGCGPGRVRRAAREGLTAPCLRTQAGPGFAIPRSVLVRPPHLSGPPAMPSCRAEPLPGRNHGVHFAQQPFEFDSFGVIERGQHVDLDTLVRCGQSGTFALDGGGGRNETLSAV